jgi:hypothetical protein
LTGSIEPIVIGLYQSIKLVYSLFVIIGS